MQIVRITEDFHLPIPKKMMEKYHFLPHLEVALEEREDGLLIKKASRQEIGERIIHLLKEGLSGVDIETIDQERGRDRCF